MIRPLAQELAIMIVEQRLGVLTFSNWLVLVGVVDGSRRVARWVVEMVRERFHPRDSLGPGPGPMPRHRTSTTLSRACARTTISHSRPLFIMMDNEMRIADWSGSRCLVIVGIHSERIKANSPVGIIFEACKLMKTQSPFAPPMPFSIPMPNAPERRPACQMPCIFSLSMCHDAVPWC